MGAIGGNFSSSIFRKDWPIIIATNRASAVLLPVNLRYLSGGYVAGQVLARNTTDGLYDKYNSAGSSGTDTAACVLFESHPAEDFTGTTTSDLTAAVGIFGGCTVFYDKMISVDADAIVDLGGKKIIDATGATVVKY